MSLVVQLNDIMAVRLGFKDLLNNVAYNVLHYRVSAITPTPPAVYQGESITPVANGLASEVFEHLNETWSGLASIQVGFTEVMVQSIHPAPKSRQYYHIPELATSGAVNDDALPLQDTPTLVKRTVLGTRWGIGRMFVVGLPELSNSAGTIVQPYITRLGEFAALLDDPLSININGVVFQFTPVLYGAPEDPDDPPRVTDLVSVALSGNTFKTQRRRRPGKGI
jgi:hypothetical protein